MTNAFDIAANSYDDSFTNTKIGRIQRNRVWKYLDKILPKDKALNILELNCGTGEDAVFFAKRNHRLLATDFSKEMLLQTQKKAAPRQLNIQTQEFDLANPHLESDKKYDLVFSNFGGLNCVSKNELENLAIFLKQHLTKDGQCIFVIMPPKTILERWYRWLKNESNIYTNRSSKKAIEVNVEGKNVATYFHAYTDIESTFEDYQLLKKMPIGFIPSYLEKNPILPILTIFDSLIYTLKSYPNYADHYLIHLQKRE